jgi:ferredoxin
MPLHHHQKKYIKKSEKKIVNICSNIKNGIIKKRGFNIISKTLGLFQGLFIPIIERRAINAVFINDDCVKCNLCVSICPMKNLENINGKIVQKSNCTICYRCINKCPKKAITVFINAKVKKQYSGLIS